MDEYTDEEWEAEKVEARERAEAEAAARPTLTFMERLAELARELEPDMDGVCTADQLLSGIDIPRNLAFEEFCVFARECMEDLLTHITPDPRAFTPMGELRVKRFLVWVIDQQPELAILSTKAMLSVYRMPIKSGWDEFEAIAVKYKKFIVDASTPQERKTPIAELIGE
jgi:hypothetical protein